jgi:hypothetical protein
MLILDTPVRSSSLEDVRIEESSPVDSMFAHQYHTSKRQAEVVMHAASGSEPDPATNLTRTCHMHVTKSSLQRHHFKLTRRVCSETITFTQGNFCDLLESPILCLGPVPPFNHPRLCHLDDRLAFLHHAQRRHRVRTADRLRAAVLGELWHLECQSFGNQQGSQARPAASQKIDVS